MLPQKNLKFFILSKAILVFGEGDLFSKHSLNRLFLMPFFVRFHIQVLNFILKFQAVYLSFLGISFKYTLLRVLVYLS